MRIIIKKNTEEAGNWVATYIIDAIKKANTGKEKLFVLGLPTGSSPLPVYSEFVKRYKTG